MCYINVNPSSISSVFSIINQIRFIKIYGYLVTRVAPPVVLQCGSPNLPPVAAVDCLAMANQHEKKRRRKQPLPDQLPPTPSLLIVHLPPEVLRCIFDVLCQHRDPLIRWQFDETDPGYSVCTDTVRTARLVCRLFNELASRFLLPKLKLRLDQASLDFAATVARNSLVACGVHHIEIELSYRPKDMADNIKSFADFVCSRLSISETLSNPA